MLIKKILTVPLRHILVVGVLGSAVYWGLLAQDRFVSEARVSVRSVGATESTSLLKVVSGLGATPRNDEQLLKDRLQSMDEALAADSALGLVKEWKSSRPDLTWHLSSDASREDYWVLWRKMVSINVEEPSGSLVIRAQGFTSASAHALTSRLVERADAFSNAAFNKLAADQLDFARKELLSVEEKLSSAREALSRFQKTNKLVDVDAQSKEQEAALFKLQGNLMDAQSELAAHRSSMTETAPLVLSTKAKVDALTSQIAQQKKLLGHSTSADLGSKWASLKREVAFYEGEWLSAQSSVEKVRMESQRRVRSLIVLEPAQVPEEPLNPGRWAGFFMWSALCALFAGCIWIIRGLVKEQSWRQ